MEVKQKDFAQQVEDKIEQNIEYKNNTKKFNIKLITIILIIGILLILSEVFLIIQFCGDPVVFFKGKKVENVEYGTVYEDKGIKAYTKLKDISNEIIIENNVDTSKIGKYCVTYKVPYLNNYKVYSRTVNVIDSKAPEIKLIGESEQSIEYGENYIENGYIAVDEYDGDISNKVLVSIVEIDKNNYENHYKVEDTSGNITEVIRHIKAIDTTAPILRLNGDSVISVITGSTYVEQGATANDSKDGDLSKNIQICGSVDTTKDGIYTLTYSVEDFSGNKSTINRTVIVSPTATTGIIYLTFDDGPSTSITTEILDVLKEKGVNATFFIINYNTDTEYLVKRAVNEGNSIGIHGYSHKYSEIYTSVEACYNNIIKLQEKIFKTTGVLVKIVRFPGGSSNTVSKKYCEGVMSKITKKVLDEGFKYYDWNVLSGDSGDVDTKEEVYNNVVKGIKPGRNNIVLMHDFNGNNKTLEALPEIIDYGLNNGYKFDIITTETEMITQKIQN